MLAAGPARAVRARAESLPLADASIDVAVSLSSIRHVGDRGAALAELRRVVRPGGAAWVHELDPRADRRRARAHASHLGSPVLRAAFGPLVLRTAPTATAIARLARTAGWTSISLDDDPDQPVYRMRLS
jgi:demethylmenaquinone methyltransferase/2-methoxy-6-polyprenyl-1,4-benzoquinol methylase